LETDQLTVEESAEKVIEYMKENGIF